MSDRINTVILQAGEMEKEHSIEHAEALLRMPENGGWHLPENSPFEMTEKNGLRVRESKTANTETGKK